MSRANLQNTISASIFLNKSLANSRETTTNLNYCILVGLHTHYGHVSPVFNQSSLGGETKLQLENHQADHFSIGNKQEKIYENLLNTKYSLKTTPGKDRLEAHHSTTTMVSAGGRAKVNPLLDPYIDAVQVRHRVNNKRGARVEAAAAAAVVTTATTGDHEPKSSYHAKTVHVEEHKEVNDEWDYSSGDSDSDDSDDEHKQHHHAAGKYDRKHGHHKKHVHYKSKNKRKRPKRRRPKKKVHNKVKVYKPKKKSKKTIYVKYKEPKTYHDHHHHHDKHHYYDKDKHHHHEHYKKYEAGKGKHYDEHHDEHHYHTSKGKLVHLDLMGKGKMSLAGVLGYTLLCVNYLLVLKEPTYDKYSGHYYTRYEPHGGHSDTVEVKTGGPLILAHCGELPEPKGLVHIKRDPSDKIELRMEEENSTTAAARLVEGMAANVSSGQNQNQTLTQSQAIDSNETKMKPAEQRRNVVHLSEFEQRPPLYYYTLSPPSASLQNDLSSHGLRSQNPIGDQQQQLNGRGLPSPIQMALNRLFSVPGFNGANNFDDNDDTIGGTQIDAGRGVQVVNGPRAGLTQQQLLTTNNGGQSGALIATGRRVVALLGQQPQVVQTRDNLVDLRTRQIEIGLRIADGRRFGLAQRTLSLTRNNRLELDRERSQDGDPENADPQASRANSSSLARQQQQQQRMLESPEYALAGDSIELTCNHRMPVDRLSAVRWFRDSLEFYRFVPTEEPQSSKTAFLAPEIDLDLARSGSQSVFLRNVTHRASGQYRCQVVTGKLISQRARQLDLSLRLTNPLHDFFITSKRRFSARSPADGRRESVASVLVARQRTPTDAHGRAAQSTVASCRDHKWPSSATDLSGRTRGRLEPRRRRTRQQLATRATAAPTTTAATAATTTVVTDCSLLVGQIEPGCTIEILRQQSAGRVGANSGKLDSELLRWIGIERCVVQIGTERFSCNRAELSGQGGHLEVESRQQRGKYNNHN